VEPVEVKIITQKLEVPVRGPGGHWYSYSAMCSNDLLVVGYGQTEREAIHDLKSKTP
jgi:hypothetical protein